MIVYKLFWAMCFQVWFILRIQGLHLRINFEFSLKSKCMIYTQLLFLTAPLYIVSEIDMHTLLFSKISIFSLTHYVFFTSLNQF